MTDLHVRAYQTGDAAAVARGRLPGRAVRCGAPRPAGAARVYTSVGFAVDRHIVAYGKAIRAARRVT